MNKKKAFLKNYITIDQAAKQSSLIRNYIFDLLESGQIKANQGYIFWLVEKTSLEKWMHSQKKPKLNFKIGDTFHI